MTLKERELLRQILSPHVARMNNRQPYCLPFGAYLNPDGTINSNKKKTRARFKQKTGNTVQLESLNVIQMSLVQVFTNNHICSKRMNLLVTNSWESTATIETENGTGEWQCTSVYFLSAGMSALSLEGNTANKYSAFYGFNQGVTLIELMVVIVIVAIFA